MTIVSDSVMSTDGVGYENAHAAFDQVRDGHPVTVIRDGKPAYLVVSIKDARRFSDFERERLNRQARRQAETHVGTVTFNTVDELMEYLQGVVNED